jgi:hypothetical protein
MQPFIFIVMLQVMNVFLNLFYCKIVQQFGFFLIEFDLLFLCFSVSLSLSIFREFICALDQNAIKITNPNFIELEEFDFTELASKLSNFHPSINFKERAAETKTTVEDVDARG